jgi:hypothetical protein
MPAVFKASTQVGRSAAPKSLSKISDRKIEEPANDWKIDHWMVIK